MTGSDKLTSVRKLLEEDDTLPFAKSTSYIAAIASREPDAAIIVPRTLRWWRLWGAPYVEKSDILNQLPCRIVTSDKRKLALALVVHEYMRRCPFKPDFFVVYPGSSIMACLAAAELYLPALCYDPAFDATVTNVRRELGNRADTIMRNGSHSAPVAEEDVVPTHIT
jgi:hypothetical protein